MPDGQQVNRGVDFRCGVQHEVVAMQVFAQNLGGAGRQRGELGQRFGRLGRTVQVAPADARIAAQVGNDRGAQLGQQRIEGEILVGFQQEGFDGVEAHQEARGQFDPIQVLSHASGWACQRWEI